MGSAATALQALETLARHQPMGVSELARRLAISKPAAQRALQALAEAQWIRRSDQQPGRWVLTVKVIEVADEMGREMGLRELARPVMQDLVDATGEAIHVSVLDGPDVVMIDQMESTQVLRIYWALGTRSPAYAAASGKAMLAVIREEVRDRHLPEQLNAMTPQTITSLATLNQEFADIRRRGYAVQRGELRDDVASIAAPILARPDEPVASISIFMPVHRFPADGESVLGALVAEAASKISSDLRLRG